jgi:MSHA biogenesis protein MshJ
MTAQWRLVEQRFAGLGRRERLILLIGGVISILVLGFVAVEGRFKQTAQLQKQISQVKADTNALRNQGSEMVRKLAQSPDAEARTRIGALQAEVERLDGELKGLRRELVAPERMAAVLEEMLGRGHRVQLVALKTLPVVGLVDGKSGEGARNVYKHGIELTLQGGYLDLLDYLVRLEKLPVQMFWANARMDAADYPRVRLVIVVYTVSLDKDWLVV